MGVSKRLLFPKHSKQMLIAESHKAFRAKFFETKIPDIIQAALNFESSSLRQAWQDIIPMIKQFLNIRPHALTLHRG